MAEKDAQTPFLIHPPRPPLGMGRRVSSLQYRKTALSTFQPVSAMGPAGKVRPQSDQTTPLDGFHYRGYTNPGLGIRNVDLDEMQHEETEACTDGDSNEEDSVGFAF